MRERRRPGLKEGSPNINWYIKLVTALQQKPACFSVILPSPGRPLRTSASWAIWPGVGGKGKQFFYWLFPVFDLLLVRSATRWGHQHPNSSELRWVCLGRWWESQYFVGTAWSAFLRYCEWAPFPAVALGVPHRKLVNDWGCGRVVEQTELSGSWRCPNRVWAENCNVFGTDFSLKQTNKI